MWFSEFQLLSVQELSRIYVSAGFASNEQIHPELTKRVAIATIQTPPF
jgi:hypothetical protein